MLSRFAAKTLIQSAIARKAGVATFATSKPQKEVKADFVVPDDVKTKRMYVDAIQHQLRNSSPEVQKEALDVINEMIEDGSDVLVHSRPAVVQYDFANEDPEFYTSKRLIGPFGTVEEPTMVFSPKPHRIVGCGGDYERSHGLKFMVLQGYMKHACRVCGQVFQLTDDPSEQITEYLPKKTEDEKMAHLLR